MTPKDDLSNWDVPDGDETDPFELLYDRRADDGRADHGQAAAPAPSEAGDAAPIRRPAWGAGALLGWRTLGGFWAVLLAATWVGAVCLQIAGPPIRPVDQAPAGTEAAAKSSQALPSPLPSAGPPAVANPPETQEATQALVPADPEPNAPVPLQSSPPASPASPARPEPAPASQTARRAPESPLPAPRQAGGSEAPNRELAGAARKRAAAPAGPPPVNADPAQPSLLIHYPSGSPEAATDAQRLAATAEPTSQSSIVAAQAGAPAVATIKYFDAKDHASARAMGKSLQQLGYRWRIERATDRTGEPPVAIEVWMPVK